MEGNPLPLKRPGRPHSLMESTRSDVRHRKESQDYKELPRSKDVETALLSAMLIDQTCIPLIVDILGSDSKALYTRPFQFIYRAITELVSKNQPVDQITVVHRLIESGKLDEVGGAHVVAQLAGYAGTSANALYHAEILKGLWARREAITALQQAESRLYDQKIELSPALDETARRLLEVSEPLSRAAGGEKQVYEGAEILARRRQGMIQRVSISPIFTGYAAIDKKVVQPFMPGGVSVIAARPRVGKSALKANLCIRLCEAGYGVLSVTPEQGYDMEMDRIDSVYTGVPIEEIIKAYHWPPGDPRVQVILDAEKVYSTEWNFAIMPRRDSAFTDILRVVGDRVRNGRRTNVVFVDLLDRVKEVREASQREKAAVIKRLLIEGSELAQRIDGHICFLAQISRGGVTQTADGRPTMEWIRDSGGWEEVCDNVWLLHRPDPSVMDIIIGKQKNGPCGDSVVVRLPFDGKTLRVEDRDYGYTPPTGSGPVGKPKRRKQSKNEGASDESEQEQWTSEDLFDGDT